MMKLISTLSVYLRYSACLLVFVGLTACGNNDESTTGASGSWCSCDDDCASVEGHTGVCFAGLCMLNTIPFNTCDDGGLNPNNLNNPNCPTGFACGEIEVPNQDEFYVCFPSCNDVNCHSQCAKGICIPTPETLTQCDNQCSLYCGIFDL